MKLLGTLLPGISKFFGSSFIYRLLK